MVELELPVQSVLEETPTLPSVSGRGLHVKLGRKWVLRDLDIQIPCGTIFTLLGPSGCGKTTLMKTVLGLYEPNEGEVRLLGHKPRSAPLVGKIGYVPQSLGLHKNLTVGEHLEMYARVSNMSASEIKQKLAEFQTRFRLPLMSSLISNLSFGQQKLVSVCAALVNSPSLAVLDEPTVGLDPYRRNMLWDYFEQMAKSGHTIFVTTHHVNEASRANTVAIMHKGRLAIQAPPNEINRIMQVDSLEKAYLKAYRGEVPNIPPTERPTSPLATAKEQSGGVSFLCTLRMVQVISELFFKTIFRNFSHDLIAFLMVSAQFIMVAYCVGPLAFDVPVHVVNDDLGLSTNTSINYANEITNILVHDPDTRMAWEEFNVTYHYHDHARQLIEQSRSFGMVYFPPNFSDVTNAMKSNRTAPFPFELFIDATDTNIRGQIVQEVYSSWIEALFDEDVDSDLQNPEHVVEYVGRPNKSMTNFFVTALFIAMTVVGGMFSAGTAFMREKEDEALDRLQAMGIRCWVIFLSDLLPFIPWIVADFPVRFLIALQVMDGPFQGRVVPLIFLNVVGFCLGNAIGVMCAVIIPSSRDLMSTLYSCFFFMYLPSGCIWPIESQPNLMYALAQANPLMWLVRAFRAIFLRNAQLSNPQVYMAFIIPPLCAVAAFTCAGLMMMSHTSLWARIRLRMRRR